MRGPLLAALALGAGIVPATAQVTTETYRRAERMLPTNADSLVLRDKIQPNWIGGTDRFWYRVHTERGAEFIYVDPDRRVRRPAFDHHRLAASLASAADTTVVGDSLPFTALDWREEGKSTAVVVSVRKKTWRCDLGNYRCDSVATPTPPDPNELPSPDKKWALYVDDYNLWVRNVVTGERRALSTDGAFRNGYARPPEANTLWVTTIRLGLPSPPVAIWSADSRRVLTHRLDERAVPETYLLQSVHPAAKRPKLWSFAFAMPGDTIPSASLVIFDVESGRRTDVAAPPLGAPFQAPIALQEVWWGDSAGTRAWYIDHERGRKAYRLRTIDGATGATRVIAEERGTTLVEASPTLGTTPNIRALAGGDILWYSERDGWGHLYLLDGATGAVKRPLTPGPGQVREILKVDEKAGRIWFTATGREAGRDPYLVHLYAVNLDGTGLTLLTPEDAFHQVTPGSGGRWVVDRFSRMDLAPVTVVRSLDSKTVMPLEKADLSRLLATGWRWPERFVAKAADGVTDVYGVLIFPSTFDRARRYPVLEEIYPGPQSPVVPKMFTAGGDLRALAELGFVGFQVDGRGGPFRSKAFHDYSYGRLENGGALEDHVAALREVAKARPYMDLDRVGIYGHSGGGFASARAMMLYPDVYKVAVSSAGNHDQRGYLSLWGELYQGMPAGDNYIAQANPTIADRLRGKLMLVYGDMDDNVAPALTIQLIEALTKANRDYDLLIVPNGAHYMAASPYFRRRRWDYFVEHLLGQTPPAGYQIRTAPEYPVGN